MLPVERGEIRKNLTELKLNIDYIDNLTRSAMAQIYAIEDRMLDQDEIEYLARYGNLTEVK